MVQQETEKTQAIVTSVFSIYMAKFVLPSQLELIGLNTEITYLCLATLQMTTLAAHSKETSLRASQCIQYCHFYIYFLKLRFPVPPVSALSEDH